MGYVVIFTLKQVGISSYLDKPQEDYNKYKTVIDI